MKVQFKPTLFGLFLLVSVLGLPPIASAYHWQGDSSTGVSERDQHSFERFLNTHEETATELSQDPDLINNRRFVRNHEALKDWLADHPDAAEAIQANPQQFLGREREYGQREARTAERMSEQDLRSFESYLDSHSETAELLYQNPDLINDRRFVRNHDTLKDWLADHPDAAEAIRANPNKFLWRQRTVGVQDFLRQFMK